jgi:hypothetical protein
MILQTPHTMSVDGDNAIIFGNECGRSSLTIFGEKQHLASFRTTGKRLSRATRVWAIPCPPVRLLR